MKKISLLVLGFGLLITSFAPKQTLIKENEDLILSCEEKNNLGINLKKVASTSSATVGKTYVQNGEFDGNRMIRFATPVSGEFSSLTYNVSIEGYSTSITKDVETIYKGIETNDEVSYFDGTNIVTEESELTNDWYWACFTIEFTSYKYYAANISAYVSAKTNSSQEEIKSEAKENITLQKEITSGSNPTLESLDSKIFGQWLLNDNKYYLITINNTELNFEIKNSLKDQNAESYVLNYVDKDGYYYVFADGNDNQLSVKYSSMYDNCLDVNGIVNNSKIYYKSFNKYVPVTSISLASDKNEYVYGIDRTITIKATFNKGVNNPSLTWSCDNDQFEVDGEGSSIYVSIPSELYEFEYYEQDSMVVTFTATSEEGISQTIEINLRKKIEVTSIALEKSSAEIEAGLTYQIVASVNDDADNKDLTYTSKNKKIATVSNTGLITGIAEGETTITIKSVDSGISKTFNIKVTSSTSAIDSYFVGTWLCEYDYNKDYPLVITRDGKATMFDVEFNLVSASKDKCEFESEDGYYLTLEKGASFMYVSSDYVCDAVYYEFGLGAIE